MLITGPRGIYGESTNDRKDFWALDWLRFLLAIYLVLFHTFSGNYKLLAGSWLDAALGLGNLATSGFFVLSGFLLTHAYVVRRAGSQLDGKSFFVARFSTLYPLHFLAFLITLIPVAVTIYTRGGISVPTEPSGTAVRLLGTTEFMMTVFTNVLLLHAWNPAYLSFNFPSWSLSALAFYYLLFPFFAPRVYKMRFPRAYIIVLGLIFAVPGATADAFQFNGLLSEGILHHNPMLRLPLFLGGMILCVLCARTLPGNERRRNLWCYAIIFFTVTVGIVLQYYEIHMHLIKNGFYYPASLAIVWLAARACACNNLTIKFWGGRLGSLALPLFLLHGCLFEIFQKSEKFVKGFYIEGTIDFGAIVATGRHLEPSISVYPLYLTLLIWACFLAQDRFVTPIQSVLRARLLDVEKDPLSKVGGVVNGKSAVSSDSAVHSVKVTRHTY